MKKIGQWRTGSRGATHYTIAHFQGVPRKGYSNRYCFSVYYGYVM